MAHQPTLGPSDPATPRREPFRHPSSAGARGRTRPDTPVPLPRAFPPVDKRALGIAVGAVGGVVMAALTVFHLALDPQVAPPIHLLAQFFYGYEVSWRGVAVGFGWGFFTGFVAGWFVAFVHNLVTAIIVFVFRAKGEFAQTKDFLDHI